MHERRNSIANALDLCLSCTNPSIYGWHCWFQGNGLVSISNKTLSKPMNSTDTFPYYWPFVRGINRWMVHSAHKKAVVWSFDVFFHVDFDQAVELPPFGSYEFTVMVSRWALSILEQTAAINEKMPDRIPLRSVSQERMDSSTARFASTSLCNLNREYCIYLYRVRWDENVNMTTLVWPYPLKVVTLITWDSLIWQYHGYIIALPINVYIHCAQK